MQNFFKSQKVNKLYVAIFLLISTYTVYKYIFVYNNSSIYSAIDHKKIKFNKKNNIFFICNFDEIYSLHSLSSINKIEQGINKEKADFYYLFVLNEANDMNFAFIDAIMLKNNLNKNQCVYIFTNDHNNFVKKHNISHYPSLILLDRNNKEKYKYIGFANENQSYQINNILNNEK